MTVEQIRAFALSFPGATEDIKWDDHLCFNVGEKMFLVTAPDHVPVSASFKTSDEDFDAMAALEGIVPAPYMARNKWVLVDDLKRLDAQQWKTVIANSYRLVFSKLTKKLQKEING